MQNKKIDSSYINKILELSETIKNRDINEVEALKIIDIDLCENNIIDKIEEAIDKEIKNFVNLYWEFKNKPEDENIINNRK